MFKRLVKKLVAQAGYALVPVRDRYVQDGLATVHNDQFRRQAAFQAAYARGVEASHGVDPAIEWRVHVALWAAAMSLRAQGDFVECGVNAGFISSAVMQYLDWNAVGRRFFLIDTFSGPVFSQYSREEVERGRLKLAEEAMARGAYVTDLDRVHANYSEWRQVFVVKGQVPDVLPALGIGQVAFLHLDMNCAYPERAALEFFWDRLPRGAVVLLDDYAYAGCNEQTMSLDAAARLFGVEVLSLPTGQGLILK